MIIIIIVFILFAILPKNISRQEEQTTKDKTGGQMVKVINFVVHVFSFSSVAWLRLKY